MNKSVNRKNAPIATQRHGNLSAEQGANGRPLPDDELWALKNERRASLIDKQSAEELSPAETSELHRLQAEIAHNLEQVAPISFAAVEALEAVARRIGALPTEDRVSKSLPD